jgi:hypothetical protein
MMFGPITIREQTMEETLYHKGEPVLKYTIRYPEFSSAVFRIAAHEMNRYYQARTALQRQRYRQILYPQAVRDFDYAASHDYPFREYEAMMVHTVTYNKNCTVSLYADNYQYTGGAHGNTIRTSDTWDLKSAQRMSLASFFAAPVPFPAFVLQSINGQIAAQLAEGTGMYFDDYEKNVTQNFNPRSFYLTDTGVVLYFQQYQIAPYASGIPEFTLAWSADLKQPRCRPV